MLAKKTNECRLPQRSDAVSGVEQVCGILPICAVPDAARDTATEHVGTDEKTAKRMMRRPAKKRKNPAMG